MPLTLPYGPVLTVEAALSAATGQGAVLNANSTFETGLANWTPHNSTIAQSSAWAQQGMYSMQITPDGVSVLAYAESEDIPVIAGQSYTAAGVVNSSSSWAGGFSFSVNWFTAGGSYISTSSASFALASGVQSRSNSFTAPATAAIATLVPTLGGTPPSSQIIWVDLVTISSTTVGFGAWDTAVWDTALWGPDEIWTDISPWVKSVNTDRKFTGMQVWEVRYRHDLPQQLRRPLLPVEPGRPVRLLRHHRHRPWRPVRIRATWAGVTYDVFRGYALNWNESYDQPSPNGGGAYMTVSCVDEMASLARFGGLAVTPVGAGELSGSRIHRVLNIAGHTGTRVVDAGNVTMQATDLSANAVEELKLTTDSEGGGLYVGRDGAVVFEDSVALVENARSNTIQATTATGRGNCPIATCSRPMTATCWSTSPPGRVPAAPRRPPPTRSAARCTATSATPAKEPDVFHGRSGRDAGAVFRPAVLQAGGPHRVGEIKPRNNPAALFPAVLSREVRDLVRARRQPPGGITITRDCHIAGIAHEITDDNWVTTFTLWSASVYQGVGRWDVATWDNSTWFA
jgi:hypothetical protein